MISPRTSLGVAIALTLAGCAGVTAADRALRTDPITRLTPADPAPWRVDFGDPVLADLLRRADAGALDVKIALARLAKAQADADAARAARRLHLGVGLDAAAGGRTLHDATSASTPSLALSNEIDIWGRLKRTGQAAESARTAAAADLVAARLTVSAEVARAYGAMRLAEAQGDSAARSLEVAHRASDLTRRRLAEGAVSQDAGAAAAAAADEASARQFWWREERTIQAAVLSDLVGAPQLDLPPAHGLASIPPREEISSDLVDGRPDVQAALARLQAADYRRAAAVAAARPQFMISAMLGSAEANIATLLDARTLAWAAAASITHNLLSGGANRARIDSASAEADEADLAYRKAVLLAWSDLRGALIAMDRADRDAALAISESARADLVLQVGERRHEEGEVDGLGVSTLEMAREAAADASRAAQARRVEARIRLALAAGGR